ncbi:MAG: glycosyltransferase, partial [Candidatus Omnitrophica bacterium]|nr:glycosyltransferase [Candidatus Omnitrophota bacterium]
MPDAVSRHLPKSDVLLLSIVLGTVWCAFYFSPRLLSLLIGPESWFAKAAVVVFVVCLNFLWMCGIYHCGHIVFSRVWRCRGEYAPLSVPAAPASVALLYLTCNDFNAAACQSCLRQTYPNYTVFICDDSDDPLMRQHVDRFTAWHPRAQVIRRAHRRGYKAGNINYALSRIDRRFTHICVNDADTVVPPDFLSKVMRYFSRSPSIGFVQALQKSLSNQTGWLGSILKYMVDIHWRYYMPLKNRYGFVMWYGHGAVLRRDVIDAIGGIPEIATEDLTFSSEARRRGYQGIVCEDVYCGEEFPQTLEKFRKRNRKWVAGTLQYLLRYYPRLLWSRQVFWLEKADIFISAAALLQAVPFIGLIAATAFIMPFYYARYQMQGPLFLVAPVFYEGPLQAMLKLRYNVFWMGDFYAVMFITIFLPLLPAAQLLRKDGARLFRYVSAASFLHLSVMLDSAWEMAAYLHRGTVSFPVTNNARDGESRGRVRGESIAGGVLAAVAVYTGNLWLIALAVALLSVPLVLRANEPPPRVRCLVAAPFLLTCTIMFL